MECSKERDRDAHATRPVARPPMHTSKHQLGSRCRLAPGSRWLIQVNNQQPQRRAPGATSPLADRHCRISARPLSRPGLAHHLRLSAAMAPQS